MKNYNVLTRQNVTDVDLVNTLKLDPQLAGTPEINRAAYDSMFNINVSNFIKQGYSEGQAKAAAGRLRKTAMQYNNQ